MRTNGVANVSSSRARPSLPARSRTRLASSRIVNFHRPCFFPDTVTDRKGKSRKRYRLKDLRTPYEKLQSLPDAAQFLKPGVTCADLDAQAAAMSDNEAARRLNEARAKLFQTFHPRSEHVA